MEPREKKTMSLGLWDPFGGESGWVNPGDRDETSTSYAQVNVDWRETDDPFGGGSGWVDPEDRDKTSTSLAQVNVDWRETDDAHIFRADLPGVTKIEEIKVEVKNGNVLEISGENVKEEEEQNENEGWDRVERSRRSFRKWFRLPDNARPDNIKCSFENGVLNMIVPKKESQQNDIVTYAVA